MQLTLARKIRLVSLQLQRWHSDVCHGNTCKTCWKRNVFASMILRNVIFHTAEDQYIHIHPCITDQITRASKQIKRFTQSQVKHVCYWKDQTIVWCVQKYHGNGHNRYQLLWSCDIPSCSLKSSLWSLQSWLKFLDVHPTTLYGTRLQMTLRRCKLDMDAGKQS